MFVRFGSSRVIQASKTLSGLWPSTQGMLKRANKRLESLDLDPDTNIYLRNRAISALELHGPNQNWDAAEYDELKEKCSTFVGNDISVDHIGTDKIGTVLDSEFVTVADFRNELEIPLLPPKDTFQVLGERCAKESIYNHVLDYATAQKLVQGSDRKRLLESVANHLCTGGWIENLWAIDNELAEQHTPGLVQAILNGAVHDTSMGLLTNAAVCSVCGNVATGELPEDEDFCACILNYKGEEMPYMGLIVIPYEINRDFYFFEDSLILPHQLGGQAGGEGADKDAKLLEVFGGKRNAVYMRQQRTGGIRKAASLDRKKAYTGISPISPLSDGNNQDLYRMIGDMPANVREHKDEFQEKRYEFAFEEEQKDITPDKYPEGTIVSIEYDGAVVDAVVFEETESGITVAIKGIEEPVEVGFDEVLKVVDLPDDVSHEKELEMIDVKQPGMQPTDVD